MVTPATSPTATDRPPHSSRHHIRALPSLPGTIRRILELLADPEVTAEQLERGLLMDPVIVKQDIDSLRDSVGPAVTAQVKELLKEVS